MIDHLVYATPDLAATVASMAERLGATPVVGGRHVGLGTRNELLAIGGGAYLEIVGPDLDNPVHGPRAFGISELASEQLVAWCACPTDLDQAIGAARAAGYEPGNATPMQRQRPDGSLLRWLLTRATLGPDGVAPLPFFIDWLDSHHPTASLPASGVALTSLAVSFPDPGVTTWLAAAGADDSRLVVAVGAPALQATLQTSGGFVTLGGRS